MELDCIPAMDTCVTLGWGALLFRDLDKDALIQIVKALDAGLDLLMHQKAPLVSIHRWAMRYLLLGVAYGDSVLETNQG